MRSLITILLWLHSLLPLIAGITVDPTSKGTEPPSPCDEKANWISWQTHYQPVRKQPLKECSVSTKEAIQAESQVSSMKHKDTTGGSPVQHGTLNPLLSSKLTIGTHAILVVNRRCNLQRSRHGMHDVNPIIMRS